MKNLKKEVRKFHDDMFIETIKDNEKHINLLYSEIIDAKNEINDAQRYIESLHEEINALKRQNEAYKAALAE